MIQCDNVDEESGSDKKKTALTARPCVSIIRAASGEKELYKQKLLNTTGNKLSCGEGSARVLDRVCSKRESINVFSLFGWRDRLLRHVQTAALSDPESPLPPTLHLPHDTITSPIKNKYNFYLKTILTRKAPCEMTSRSRS